MDNIKENRTANHRRKFNYTAYFPERRLGQDRRKVAMNQLKKKR